MRWKIYLTRLVIGAARGRAARGRPATVFQNFS